MWIATDSIPNSSRWHRRFIRPNEEDPISIDQRQFDPLQNDKASKLKPSRRSNSGIDTQIVRLIR